MNQRAVLNSDFHTNDNPPTREELENWTNRARHELLIRDMRGRLKSATKNMWCYLFYPDTGFSVRFMVDRKNKIYNVETHTIEEGNRLVGITRSAMNALNNNPN